MAKKGFFAKLIDGPERSETYARSTLPTNRWELGWDLFKTNMSKLFGLNWLTLLFLLPIVAIFVIRYLLKAYQISVYPFSQNLGMGYPFFPATSGLEAQLTLSINVETFKFLIIGIVIGAVAISGGFYVMRNMVWAEGVMIASDFFKGVKQNFLIVLASLLFYSVIMVFSILSIDMSNLMMAQHQGVRWMLVFAQVITYIIMVIATMMVLYMITLGVTYKLKFTHLVRNAFILTIALFPTNIFFAAFAAVWFILLFIGGNFFFIVGLFLCLAWGISLFMLIWTDYSHWVFDKFINDRVPGAKKNRGIYKKEDKVDEKSEELIIEKSKLTSKPIKPITDYDIELYELPQSFSRKDLEKLEETKEAMRRDSDLYTEEHLHDNDKKPETFEDLLSEEEREAVKSSMSKEDKKDDE